MPCIGHCVYVSVYRNVYVSIYMNVCVSIYINVCVFIFRNICVSIYKNVYVFVEIWLCKWMNESWKYCHEIFKWNQEKILWLVIHWICNLKEKAAEVKKTLFAMKVTYDDMVPAKIIIQTSKVAFWIHFQRQQRNQKNKERQRKFWKLFYKCLRHWIHSKLRSYIRIITLCLEWNLGLVVG